MSSKVMCRNGSKCKFNDKCMFMHNRPLNKSLKESKTITINNKLIEDIVDNRPVEDTVDDISQILSTISINKPINKSIKDIIDNGPAEYIDIYEIVSIINTNVNCKKNKRHKYIINVEKNSDIEIRVIDNKHHM